MAASFYGGTLLGKTKQPLVLEAKEMGLAQLTLAPVSAQPVSPSPGARSGSQVSLNGRKYPFRWVQRQAGISVRTSISDAGLTQRLGVELLSTADLTKQPVRWFSQGAAKRLVLATQRIGAFRYLDITDFAKANGWQLKVDGSTLAISSVPARVTDIQPPIQLSKGRVVVALNRSTPWQINYQGQQWVMTLEGTADAALLERFKPLPKEPEDPREEEQGERRNNTNQPNIPPSSALPISPSPTPPLSPSPTPPQPPPLIVETAQNQTTIRGNLSRGLYPRVSMLSNPNRLIIELQPEVMVERDILWAPGIRWRQQYVELPKEEGSKPAGEQGSRGAGEQFKVQNPESKVQNRVDRFPVILLAVNLRSSGLTLKPIWSNPNTQVGIAPLIQTAQIWQAVAAINAGFFNRNNQLPLGGIKRDDRWLSGPILNRGAMAWNERGQVMMGRLSLEETLITSAGERLPVLYLNSGYVQAGIARYTPEWGPTYTPLTDNEALLVVQNNQVMNQLSGDIAGKTAFPIPPNGYLLAIRANPSLLTSFPVGTTLRLESITTPSEFNRYPQIVAAGPLLLQNRQIVLDAKAEKFSDAFIAEAAVRSAIGTTADGNLMIVAIHNRTGGRGPTLAETAQLMQRLGAVDALNLDGGSSTSLYLGGQLINRPSYTAARVHNGLGIFLP